MHLLARPQKWLSTDSERKSAQLIFTGVISPHINTHHFLESGGLNEKNQ